VLHFKFFHGFAVAGFENFSSGQLNYQLESSTKKTKSVKTCFPQKLWGHHYLSKEISLVLEKYETFPE